MSSSAEIHARLAVARREAKDDPIVAVGTSIASEARLLCLDELFVTDIADATILNRLFATLIESSAVVVLTSNSKPSDLYKNGRNRDQFLPFIDLVEQNLELFQLEAAHDYRLEHLSHSTLYFSPDDDAAKASMDELWRKLTFGEPCASETILVLGHKLYVPCACLGAARFSFTDLFEKPLGTQDYLALARHYHTIFVDGIPKMGRIDQNPARRFLTFIDTLYDHRTGFVASAEVEPGELYQAGDDAQYFERTVSRIMEMRSPEYLAQSSEASADKGPGSAPPASKRMNIASLPDGDTAQGASSSASSADTPRANSSQLIRRRRNSLQRISGVRAHNRVSEAPVQATQRKAEREICSSSRA